MRPAVEQQAPLVGRLLERAVGYGAEAREQDEQRAARDGADGIELQAADALRDCRDRLRIASAAARGRDGQALRVQGEAARRAQRDDVGGQIPSPGRNSFVNARGAVCVLGIRSLSAIHSA